MRLDKFTTKFQEALSDAQSIALGNDNAYIEPVHLLVAMLKQDDGPKALLQRAGANVPGLLAAAEAAVKRLPSVQGQDQVQGGRAGRGGHAVARPHLLGETGVFDGFDRIVGPRAGDDRDPSRHLLDHQLHHPAVLVVGQGRTLPRGTDRHYAMGPLLYVPLHQTSQRGLVQLALSKWGDQGNYRTLKHGISFS